MACSTPSIASLPWPSSVPTGLKDLTATVASEDEARLTDQPDSVVTLVMEQWEADGGTRDPSAANAVYQL
eukprot:1146208-Alexandrium_andersonii.AAC.1